jgi:NDP-sugar pyrophosphorylase family protein
MKMIKEDIIILCGGNATRLYPLTDRVPKSMLLFNDKPFLKYQIELLKKKGFNNIILSVGHLAENIVRYAKEENNFNVIVRFVDDGGEPLGTGGAVKKASRIATENFFVLNGDSYLDMDYSDMLEKYYKIGCSSMMAVYKNNNESDKSNVAIKNGKVIYYKKNPVDETLSYIDYGLSIFNKKVFERISAKIFDMEIVNNFMVEKEQMYAYEVFKRFYEIGSFSGIENFENFIKKNE